MIDLYSWSTPNGHKVHIMLEECGLPYTPHPVDINRGDQLDPKFRVLNPNGRIPVIVDQDGPGGRPLAVAESGAVLFYLAEKTGRFLPKEHPSRYSAMQWLMFQMSGIGPMFGQLYHFRTDSVEKLPYAIDRYTNEARRLYRVLNERLAGSPYLAGDEYTIADMATWPWCHAIDRQGHDPKDYPDVMRWFEAIKQRPAVQRGVKLFRELRKQQLDEASREVLFGKRQFEAP
jgi:GSH-dependent disulfide-bond oxidoreductase